MQRTGIYMDLGLEDARLAASNNNDAFNLDDVRLALAAEKDDDENDAPPRWCGLRRFFAAQPPSDEEDAPSGGVAYGEGDGAPRLLSQRDATSWLGGLTLTKRLSAGGFGVAFVALADAAAEGEEGAGSEWVVKLPRDLMLTDKPTLPARIADVLLPPPAAYAGLSCAPRVMRRWKRAQDEFIDECRNAELILEPPLMRAMRAAGTPNLRELVGMEKSPEKVARRLVGMPLRGVSRGEHARLLAELARYRAHPGFAHLHRIVHFDPRIPAIVSTLAAGSLLRLRALVPEYLALASPAAASAGLPGPLVRRDGGGGLDCSRTWCRIARQVGSALAFIEERTTVAHIDLKPDNILFRGAPHAPHCLLGDYGICEPRATPIGLDPTTGRLSLSGTLWYNPPKDDVRRWEGKSARAQSAYQFFATLADLVWHAPDATHPHGPYFASEAMLQGESGIAERVLQHPPTEFLDSATSSPKATKKRTMTALLVRALGARDEDPERLPDLLFKGLLPAVGYSAAPSAALPS